MNEKPISEAFLERLVGGEVELVEGGQSAFKPEDYLDLPPLNSWKRAPLLAAIGR